MPSSAVEMLICEVSYDCGGGEGGWHTAGLIGCQVIVNLLTEIIHHQRDGDVQPKTTCHEEHRNETHETQPVSRLTMAISRTSDEYIRECQFALLCHSGGQADSRGD